MLPRVPAYYMAYIGETLAESGVDVALWLQAASAEKMILENENTWIPLQQYLALINSAVELSPDPGIGLKVGNKLGIPSHGMLGFALLTCADLAQAVTILRKYIGTRTPLLQPQIRHEDQQIIVYLKASVNMGNAYRSFVETAMVSLVNLFTTLTGVSASEEVVKQVTFDYEAPLYVNRYADFLTPQKQFEAPDCSIVMDDSRLHQHFKNADSMMLKNLTAQFEAALQQTRYNQHQSFAFRVTQILEQERHQIPSLENVARMLFMTSRTLHRHLLNEGTSFRQLLSDTKCKQARDYLRHTNMTVQQIAWALGYEDVANFRRAFKSWMGLTPQSYRHAQQ